MSSFIKLTLFDGRILYQKIKSIDSFYQKGEITSILNKKGNSLGTVKETPDEIHALITAATSLPEREEYDSDDIWGDDDFEE